MYRAYELLEETIRANRTRLVPTNHADNRLGDQASVLISRDAGGTIRALFIDRDNESFSVRVENESGAMIPMQTKIFDNASGEFETHSLSTAEVAVPAKSLALVQY